MGGPAAADSDMDKVKKLLETSPGLDKFKIASKLGLDVVETQKILSALQDEHVVVSGFSKPKGSSTYNRLYFLL